VSSGHPRETVTSDGRGDDAVLLRRAHALLVELEGTVIRVVNFLTRRSAVVSAPVLAYLRDLAASTPRAEAAARIPASPERACVLLDRLVEATMIHRVGSPAEIEDQRWADAWKFGAPAAALQFARRSAVAVDPAERAHSLRQTPAARMTVPLSLTHSEHAATVPLPPADPARGITAIMAQRRSAPRFAQTPVTAAALAEILFALAAVTGWTEDPVLGALPLSLSPSAGARNPYEAYVIIRLVDGIAPGTYHYDQGAGTLLRLGGRPPDMAAFAGGQPWAADAAFVVLLVGFFDRMWSKYPTPNGYLNLIIEAGHRAQNALLVATELGLGGRTTTAIDDAVAHRVLELCPYRHAPVYLLAFGHPEQQGASP
jgi:SagB-type dehydrogenase family enzyme